MLTQNLGYPRIGDQRQLKKASENYWAGKPPCRIAVLRPVNGREPKLLCKIW